MPRFRRICCAIDFSELSRGAMQAAAELARDSGAALTLLHVAEHSAEGAGGPLAPPPVHRSRLDPDPRELEAWRAEAERLAGPAVSAVLLGPPVANAIVDFARDTAIDLIVLASHGRTGFRRLVLGSVTESVLRTAPCPVLVVRGPPSQSNH